MGDENHIRTLGDYSKPSHEGYRNTIELPVGNNVVPLRSDTIRRTIDQSAGGKLRDLNPEESWTILEDLALYENESWNDPRDFVKLVKAIALPQDVPNTRLSKFEADFKQQQSEMTNKIDTVLKAITDRITGTLPSDTVKNPKLGTHPVLSARSYPTTDPQCSTQVHSSINTITIHPKQPENPKLVPQSSNTKFVCSKEDDGEVMFIEIIRDDDEPQNEDPNKEEGATTEEPVVEYFDTFPTRDELTYHRHLMSGPIPSIFLRNPIISEGCPYNLKIPCNIRYVHIEKAYIDLNSPLNIMTRMMYNWIIRRKLNPRGNTNGGIINFTGRIKGMHVFVGNFTYVMDFMIVEDISLIIDPRFVRGADEVTYEMPHKIEQYDSLSDLEKEHTKSVYLRNEEDKRRGVEYVMSKILGFYKECLELGPEYLTGVDDEGEVTLYLMRRSLEVLKKFHWMILGGRFNPLSHVSSPLLSKPGEYHKYAISSLIDTAYMMSEQIELRFDEKLSLALVHAARRLKGYFQGHVIKVITNKPINQILNGPEASERLAKWAAELGDYGITYASRNTIKGQISHIPREKNKKVDALRKLAVVQCKGLTKRVLVEELNERSVDVVEVNVVVEEEGKTWMTPIREYVENGTL
ncbi:hypothetical protein Tco_1438172 [Tanacetum coccineum]